MNLAEWLPGSKDLEALQGVERDLRARRRRGTQQSLALLVAGVALQLLPLLAGKDLSALGKGFMALWSRDPKLVGDASMQLIGLGLSLSAALIYLLARHSSLLLAQSREPFRYSFQVTPFAWVEGTPGERQALQAADRLRLLHLDLTERLAGRIKRLSLLQAVTAVGAESSGPSHVTICGDIALREDPDQGWMLYALPRVRIGSAETPQTLAFAVRFRLGTARPDSALAFRPEHYLQFCERVYASVAFAVYGRIDADLEDKLRLFPTTYRRAVARLNEADDLAWSNTIEANERAARLYQQALSDFNRSWTRAWARGCFVAGFPLAGYHRVYCTWSAILAGLARSKLSHAYMAALVGRPSHPTRGLREPLLALVGDLKALDQRAGAGLDDPPRPLKAPRRSPWAERRRQNRQQRRQDLKAALLDARVALAMAHDHVGEVERSAKQTREAGDEAPALARGHRDYLWLIARAETAIDARIDRLRSLIDLHPDFQLGQYDLAYWLEMQMRARGVVSPERCAAVLREYRRVLEINPGNIAALVALGYIHWLLGQLEQAQARFHEGMDLKEIVRETFVGELSQGLARVRAEQALECAGASQVAVQLLMESLELYELAVATDPSLATSSAVPERRTGAGPFEWMSSTMLGRFQLYRRRVQKAVRLTCGAAGGAAAPWVSLTGRLRGHVANDVGNAALEAHVRLRNPRHLRWARYCYRHASTLAPDLSPAWLNRHISSLWSDDADRVALDKAIDLQPAWLLPRTFRIDRLRPDFVEQSRQREQDRRESEQVVQEADEEIRKHLKDASMARQLLKGTADSSTIAPHTRRQRLKAALARRGDARRALKQARAQQHDAEFVERWTGKVRKEIEAQLKRVPVGRRILAAGGVPDADHPRPFSSVLEDRETDLSELSPSHVEMLGECVRALLVLRSANPFVLEEALALARVLRERLSNEDFMLARLQVQVLDENLEALPPENEGREALEQLRQEAQSVFRSTLLRWAKTDPVNNNLLDWCQVADPMHLEQEAWPRAAHHPYADEATRGGMAWLRLRWAQEAIDRALWAPTEPHEEWAACGRHLRIAGGLARRLRDDCSRSALAARREQLLGRLRSKMAQQTPARHRSHVRWRLAVAACADSKAAPAAWMEAVSAAAAWLEAAPLHVTARLRFERAAGQARSLVKQTDQQVELRRQIELTRTVCLAACVPGDHWFLATPLTLEVAKNLIPLVADEEEKLTEELKAEVGAMKDAVNRSHGVHLPGVLFRGNDGLEKDSFAVWVHEVRIADGRVDPDGRYWAVPAEDEQRARSHWPTAGWREDPLNESRFAELDAAQALDPPSGLPGAPLSPLAMMMRHLCGVLELRLEDFVGPHEMDTLLDEAGVPASDAARMQPELLGRLTSLARSLLNAGLPLAVPAGLARLVVQEAAEGPMRDFDALVMRARALPPIRQRLLQRVQGRHRWGLAPELLARLVAALAGDGDARCLAPTPELERQVQKAAERAIDKRVESALIVDAPALVPGVWAMLQHEWPRLLVVAADELPIPHWFGLAGSLTLE